MLDSWHCFCTFLNKNSKSFGGALGNRMLYKLGCLRAIKERSPGALSVSPSVKKGPKSAPAGILDEFDKGARTETVIIS